MNEYFVHWLQYSYSIISYDMVGSFIEIMTKVRKYAIENRSFFLSLGKVMVGKGPAGEV